jgi:DNA-binding winged helix-turn-helix (wHTH) protein
VAIGERYQFGDFTLDVAERRLCRRGAAVHVAPKALDLLMELVRQAGHLVTHEQLLARVWPEAFVEDGILAVYISGLRKALGDSPHGAPYIETVPRAGYRFVAPVAKTPHRVDGSGDGANRPLKAFELVGWGREHLFSASFFQLSEAVAAFQSAIELDRTYAAAHAGLAIARISQAVLRAVPHQEAYADAKASALRALAMDGSCADAVVALGVVLFLSEWDWTAAERSFQRALEIDPNHAQAYLFYGALMEALGRLERGLQLKQLALERDPTSGFALVQIAVSFWNQRRYVDTIVWTKKALDRDPRHPMARELLSGAYWKLGDFERLEEEEVTQAAAFGVPEETLVGLKQRASAITSAYHAGGHAAVARYILEHLPPDAVRHAGLMLPVLYGEAGEMDAAFDEMNRALDLRDPALPHLAVAPGWDCLRRDDRFNQLLARMGLPEQSPG